MPRISVAISLLLACCAVDAGSIGRIASLNLCTDSMLFELAAPEKIVSVTHLSRDPRLSYFASRAQTIAVNRGHIEEIIAVQPDLVLAVGGDANGAVALLKKLDYRVQTFTPILGLADFRVAFLQLADTLGVRTKALSLLAAMDAALAHERATSKHEITAIVYRPNGFSPGQHSLASDLMSAAGLRNLAAELGNEYGAFIPLEKLVYATPDLILLGVGHSAYPSLAESVLRHPAIRKTASQTGSQLRLTVIDERYWTCPGTYSLAAVARLKHALAP